MPPRTRTADPEPVIAQRTENPDEAPEPSDEPVLRKDGKFIRYNAIGDRIITKEDWERVNVTGQDEAVWSRLNAYRIPTKEFSDEALNYLLRVDDEFVQED